MSEDKDNDEGTDFELISEQFTWLHANKIQI